MALTQSLTRFGLATIERKVGNVPTSANLASLSQRKLNALGLPLAYVDCDRRYRFVNKAFLEWTGKVFTDVIPDIVATEKEIACTVCSILYRTPSEIPQNKHPSKIRIVLDEHGGVAQAGGDQIQFDLNYINGYKGRDPAVTVQRVPDVATQL